MSSLIRVKIIPSKMVGLIVSLPFVSTLAILTSRDINIQLLIAACLLVVTAGYYFVNLFGFVSLKPSITELQISDSKIFLVNEQSGKKEYELLPQPILNPYFCVLSFKPSKFDSLGPPHPLAFLKSTYRNVIVSRYNVNDFASFRRARVKLRFGQ